jgi:hypothetical protein
MTKITDPAAELAELLQKISLSSQQTGSAWLAANFEVDEWSLEFYQIVFSIIQRIEFVRKTLSELDGFEHLKGDMENHLDSLKQAFNAPGLQNTWASYGAVYVHATHIQALKMSSAFLRTHISYRDLKNDERLEVIATATELRTWLIEHQLEENDFVRQTIIEGVDSFIFRLERLQWLGWGYSLESLKAIIMAYLALERGVTDEAEMPNAGAAMRKVGAGLKEVFRVVGISKDVVDRADFALKAYGAMSLAIQSPALISGLLGN